MPLLSVIVPAYNEEKTIRQILEKINLVGIDKEIIVIDNGSYDNTGKILREINYPNLKVIHFIANRGKGGAVLTGMENAKGDFVIIQDADLEYDPQDYLKLIEAIKKDNADIVLGARFYKGYRGLLMHRWGNKFLTNLINILFDTNLNDYSTCYKLMRREIIPRLNLKARSFDIDAEIITKAIKEKLKIAEVPISYHPRDYSEGKKIRWKDGIEAMTGIIKHRFT